MKIKSFKFLLLSLFAIILSTLSLSAQSGEKIESPKMTTTGKIGEANVSITYGSPSVRGRKIWGKLVPFDKVWRTGANEVTQIETDKALTIEGKRLAKGKYSIYTIPGESDWKVIFNSEIGQWGTIGHTGKTTRKSNKDVLIVTVKSKKAPKLAESLIFQINKDEIILAWENLVLPISVK